jgi:hypothetical protein
MEACGPVGLGAQSAVIAGDVAKTLAHQIGMFGGDGSINQPDFYIGTPAAELQTPSKE